MVLTNYKHQAPIHLQTLTEMYNMLIDNLLGIRFFSLFDLKEKKIMITWPLKKQEEKPRSASERVTLTIELSTYTVWSDFST